MGSWRLRRSTRSITVAGSKIVRSASAPTLRRPLFAIAGVRRSRRRAGSSVIRRSGVHQRHHLLVADVFAQHLGKRARRARVAAAVLDEAVAGDHRERAGDGRARLCFGSPVDDHRAAGRARLAERGARQALAGRHELVQCETFVRPGLPVVEQRRLDLGHARAVRIRFGRHVLPGVARGLDRREKRVDLGVGRRVDVDDVQRRRARCGRRRWSPAALRARRACGCGPRRRPRPRRGTCARSRTSARQACRRCRIPWRPRLAPAPRAGSLPSPPSARRWPSRCRRCRPAAGRCPGSPSTFIRAGMWPTTTP